MTDRDKIMVIAAMLNTKPVIKEFSIAVPAWRRRFLIDRESGEIKGVQDMIRTDQPSGGWGWKYVTIARADEQVRVY